MGILGEHWKFDLIHRLTKLVHHVALKNAQSLLHKSFFSTNKRNASAIDDETENAEARTTSRAQKIDKLPIREMIISL
jgi:hypothetical protein